MSTKQIVRGEALLASLAVCALPVKLLRDGQKAVPISVERALPIVRGGIYEGVIKAGRLRSIREIEKTPTPIRDDHYRDGMPILNRYYKPVDCRTVDLWDRIMRRAAAA